MIQGDTKLWLRAIDFIHERITNPFYLPTVCTEVLLISITCTNCEEKVDNLKKH